MVAMLLYVQWTKAQYTAKLSKWMLKLNKKGYTATIVAVKKITSANCHSGRSYETAVDFEKVNLKQANMNCDPGRNVTLCSVD